MNISTLKAFQSKFRKPKDLIENLYLKAIIDSYQRIRIIPGVNQLTENEIRDKFVLDFENTNPLLKPYIQNKTLFFTNENRILTPISTSRTDIEFIVSWYGKFVVECKRLSSAEQRYIDDGLIRFTTSLYSASEDFAGMVSFILSGNCQNISNTLKTKVENFEFHISSKKLLSKLCSSWQYSFQSKHLRAGKKEIHIYHLFFEFK